MAEFVALHNKLLVGQLDLTSIVNEVGYSGSRAMVPCTTFADGGFMVATPGQISGEVMGKGYSSFAAGVLDDTINNSTLGTAYPVSVIPNPTGTVTAGDTAWLTRAIQTTYRPFGGAKGDAAMFELTLTTNTALVQGQVSHAAAARTSTGNGTALTLTGPSSSQSLYSAVHVTAYSGLDSVVLTVESDDNSGFTSATTRITHTTFTAIGSEWKSVAGDFSTETYHRIVYTLTGTGSVTFTATLGVI